MQRRDLVAGYVGQTAIQTMEQIEAAMGGMLFIDEDYRFLVVAAGYPGPMDEFLNSNEGTCEA